jgi:hypothetical protein
MAAKKARENVDFPAACFVANSHRETPCRPAANGEVHGWTRFSRAANGFTTAFCRAAIWMLPWSAGAPIQLTGEYRGTPDALSAQHDPRFES